MGYDVVMAGAALQISEVFHSIQGEGTRAGLACAFVRLAGCDLRCRYCDTAYAWGGGESFELDRILAAVTAFDCDLIQVTGGEPLQQQNVHSLMTRLCDLGKTVLLETSGAYDIAACDRRVVRIMDLKTPGSGEQSRNRWSNIDQLTGGDEVKFVICDRIDYDWARRVIERYDLADRVAAVLLSPAWPIGPADSGSATFAGDLAEWILADRLPVRLQIQLHKLIWPSTQRGV